VVTRADRSPSRDDLTAFGEAFAEAVAAHRHFDRQLDLVPA